MILPWFGMRPANPHGGKRWKPLKTGRREETLRYKAELMPLSASRMSEEVGRCLGLVLPWILSGNTVGKQWENQQRVGVKAS